MQTALILSHPNLDASKANSALLNAVRDLPGVELAHLENLYPDRRIDYAAEVARLLGADRIVLQFPMYWYSTPPLLKQWQDDVLTPLLYLDAETGAKLAGKPIRVATTTGGEPEAYREGGRNMFTVEQLLAPLRAMANRAGFEWEKPFVAHNMMRPEPDALAFHATRYRSLLGGASLAAAA